MYEVYKVTDAEIKKTHRGYKIFSLELEKSFTATKPLPLTEREKRWCKLYKQYLNNNQSLNFLVGRYIALTVEDSKFGKNFYSVASFDALQDFKNLLDKNDGEAFFSDVNIFKFLENRGYPVNADGSITLKEPYSHYSIKLKQNSTVCYPSKQDEGTFTVDNLELIYDHFYKGKYIETHNDDCKEEYYCSPVSIGVFREKFFTSKTGTESTSRLDFFRIGGKLPEEHLRFLAEIKNNLKK